MLIHPRVEQSIHRSGSKDVVSEIVLCEILPDYIFFYNFLQILISVEFIIIFQYTPIFQYTISLWEVVRTF